MGERSFKTLARQNWKQPWGFHSPSLLWMGKLRPVQVRDASKVTQRRDSS